jgi:amino acid transporter
MKMSQREKVTVALAFFAAWGVIFFGIWQVSILSDFHKLLIDIVWTIVFVSVSISYAYLNRIKPKLKQTMLRFRMINIEPWVFWTFVVFGFITSFLGFELTRETWEVFAVSDVPVITYNNLISLSFSIMGGYIIVFLINRIVQRRKKQKEAKKQALDDLKAQFKTYDEMQGT